MKLLTPTLTLLFAGCFLNTSPYDQTDPYPKGEAGAPADPPTPNSTPAPTPTPAPAPAPAEAPAPAAMSEAIPAMDDPPPETDDPPQPPQVRLLPLPYVTLPPEPTPEPPPAEPPPQEPPAEPIPSTTDARVGQCPTSVALPLSCYDGMCQSNPPGIRVTWKAGVCVSDGDCPDQVYNPGGTGSTRYRSMCLSRSCVIDCS